ncbi:EAL domain-containing protein [Colwellia sp. KU-HH00111]|uniref:EAL domain-containing protein n=1 Tax=Colwellia sp. KU-HH00111 TaxID=3127652 RepID=UPI0033656797
MIVNLKCLLQILLVGWCFLMVPVHGKGQVNNLFLEQLSVEDGLTQGTINSILADQNGFVWLATDSGINIYDGYSFRQLSGPDNSFIDSSIYFVEQDSFGFVWINVNEGVYRYQPSTNQYQLILASSQEVLDHFVVDVTEGMNSRNVSGNWVATSKTVSFYDHNNAELKVTVDLSQELPEKENIFQVIYHQQVLYIGTRVGVYAYHIKLDKWRKLPKVIANGKFDEVNTVEANKSYNLFVSKQHDLYMGTGDGVFSVNINNIKTYIQGRTSALEYTRVLKNTSVWQFLLADEQLYVASYSGLYAIDTEEKQGKRLFGISDFFDNSSDDKIISLAQDNSGVFWLGSESSGVYLWDPLRELIENYRHSKSNTASLSHSSVWAMLEADNNPKKFWVGTTNGLNLVDLKEKIIIQQVQTTQENSPLQNTPIYHILPYREEILLLSTTRGVFFYNTRLQQLVDLPFTEQVKAILAKDHYSIFLQEQRYLWLVYDEKTVILDLKTGQVDRLTELGKVVPLNKIFNFLGFLPDSHSMLFSTNDSLWRYNTKTKQTQLLYTHANVLGSEWVSFENWVIDKNNVFWISYPTKGLVGLAYPSFELKYFYNSENSIIDNNVYSLQTDSEGDVWFSSHKGLFLLNTDSQHIRNFTVIDGLPTLEFNGEAQLKLPDGKLVYGSMEGIIVFDPLALKRKYEQGKMNIYSTSIDVLSRQLNLPLLINQNADVLLRYDDVGIRFDFSTLSYADRKEVIYEYQLLGDNNVSYPPTTDNRITFPSLPSGHHVLTVRAKSPVTGEYSPVKHIDIQVSYAPWQSPSAYFAYLVIFLVVTFLWLHRRNLQKQELLTAHEEVKFRENRLQLALTGSSSEVWDWQANSNMMFGKRISQELGYIDFATSHTFAQHVALIHPDDKDQFLNNWQAFVEANNLDDTFTCTYRLQHADGQWLWYKDLGKIVTLDKDNKPCRITGSYTNITKTRAEEVRSQYYGEAFKQTNEWVLIVNHDFTEVTANQSLRNVFGLPEENFNYNDNFMGLDKRRWLFFQYLFPSLDEGEHWHGEELVRADSGEEFHVVVNINVGRNKTTNNLHYVCVFTDISAQKSAEKELRYLANYDHLTDLPNRSLLLERIKHAMQSSDRLNSSIALFFIDLDKFKQVNDSLGHDSGDLLLVEVTRRLSEILRVDDTIARIGGDEFVVLLENFSGVNQLGQVAQKIITAVEQPVLLQEYNVSIGASIGIALYPDDANDSSTLLRHADVAMYHAKQLGRNTFQFFTARMNIQATERLTKESNIKLAFSNDEFFNHYQPIMDSRTGKAVGFEMLMRWQSNQCVIAPAGFIDIAEEIGLIIPMTEAALERGLIDLKKWHRERPALYLSVNLSPQHFGKESLVPYIANLLKKYDLPAHLLKIEVTESALITEPEKAIKTMNELSSLGVILALDDFGTGFSSLSYLKKLPLDIIKIDRSFVSGISVEKTDEAIVDATIVLAERLNMHCIAEGVETRAQLDYLTQRSCYYIQGYLYSKPVDAKTIGDYLNANAIELKISS